MKIGILTFHRCINYGSYWQSRCLADGLRALGHDAVILDHHSRAIDIAEWRCALHPVPAAAPARDLPRYRRKLRRFLASIEALPLSPRFPLDAPAQVPACDAVVVGSDEVWNLSHPWYGGRPLFYGEGLGTPRLVAYAASFGHHDASTPLEAPWSRRLSRFHRIAVRDSASQATVERAIGTATPIVLDPCLQFPPEVECTTHRPERGYVAVYGHGFTPAFVAQVRRWAKANALLVASIGYRNDWADRQWIDAGPRDFAGFMAGASAVATNFFHGCVFALRFARPFVCEPSWYRSTKLRCLLQDLHGQDHLLEGDAPPAQIDRLLREPLGADIQRRIVQRRRRSLRYLERALGTGARRA